MNKVRVMHVVACVVSIHAGNGMLVPFNGSQIARRELHVATEIACLDQKVLLVAKKKILSLK